MSATAPNLLSPLLGRAFPPSGLTRAEQEAILRLQKALDAKIAPGRYPTDSISALKQSGILAAAIPQEFGGLGFSFRASMEAQLRIAVADSAVSQIYKIHEECLREAVLKIPDEFRPALLKAVISDQKLLGLAVAETGRKGTISLHDPVDWKHAEIDHHVLTGWEPPRGIYQ
jgi:alkylation response protein AidB-like acyl-CoA dehydrogenase